MQENLIFPALLICMSLYFAACQTYYVKPTNDSKCPEFLYPCHTLAFYANDSRQYFRSDTTMIFLNGIHEIGIGEFIVVKDIENLALIGAEFVNSSHEPPATVMCTRPTGLAFFGISNLTISSMAFLKCGCAINNSLLYEATVVYSKLHQMYGRYQNDTYAAMLIVGVYSMNISHTSIQNSTGYGLLAINILGNSSLQTSEFLFNNYYSFTNLHRPTTDVGSLPAASCQGGGALFFFAELANCSNTLEQYGLDIVSTRFWFGVDSLCGPHSLPANRYIVGGSGIGVVIGSVSYGITVRLRDVVSAENIRVAGANIYIVLYDFVANYSVHITNTSSFRGNFGLRNYSYDENWLDEGTGMLFQYGMTLEESVVRNCSRNSDQMTLKGNVDISDSHFNENYGKIGVGVSFELQPLPGLGYDFALDINIRNCTLNKNIAGFLALGASVIIREYNQHPNKSPFTIVIQNSSFSQTELLTKNLGIPDLAIFSIFSTVHLSSVKNVTFINCTFLDNMNTAMVLMDTVLHLEGNITFTGNTGYFGGGLALRDNSIMYLKPDTHVYFINNYAYHRGGAMYVTASDAGSTQACFFQMLQHNSSASNANVQLTFINNTAVEAGNTLFGGNVDSCVMQDTTAYSNSSEAFQSLFNITDYSETMSISSTPQQPCFCSRNLDRCDADYNSISLYPGEFFLVDMTVVGQRNGAVPGSVHSVFLPNTSAHLKALQRTQLVNRGCKNLTYNVYSSNKYERLTFAVEYLDTMGSNSAYIYMNIQLKECPPGFQLSNEECICDAPLQNLNVTCDIDDQTVSRSGSLWVYLQENVTSKVIVHQHCPFDYCKSENVKVNLSDPNIQCAFQHAGILCGGCQAGLSATFGGSRCKKCSNYFVGMIAAFVAAGVALVAVMVVCNLTISVGTLNGLIFYANIVRINHPIFFPPDTNTFTNFLSVFIAWINLDLGIESCFYDGMDFYSKTGLQFVFPVYLWTIVVLLIFLSKRYSIVVRLIGTHAPQVLATLFLLSYAKLERAIITVLSSTSLDLGEGNYHHVWLYDGNVTFLQGKHIGLVILALLFGLLFVIPFTVVIFCAPCFQARSRHWLLRSWFPRFIPFIDAYLGPYRNSFRCWMGAMLVIRTGLFIAFAVNTSGDPNINLVAIATAMSGLLAVCWNIGPVYQLQVRRVQFLRIHWPTEDGRVLISPLDTIETSFFLNLVILSVLTLFSRSQPTVSQTTVISVSVTLAFGTFIVILCYHFWEYTAKVCYRRLMRFWNNRIDQNYAEPGEQRGLRHDVSDDSDSDGDNLPLHQPSVTYISRPVRSADVSLRDPCKDTESQHTEPHHFQGENSGQPPAAANVGTASEQHPHDPPLRTNFSQLREPLDLISNDSSN